jgi:hypothetical protein
MTINRTFKQGQKIQQELPYADREWTAQIADTVGSLGVASGECGDTKSMLTGVDRLGSRVRRLENGCFQDCSRLRSASVPPTVKELGGRCFAGCEQLAEVQIAARGLTSVGGRAFDGCGARSLTLPATLSSASMIDAEALAGSNLTSLTLLGIDSSQLTSSVDPGPEPEPQPEPKSGPYKVLNPQVYGIDDWQYFRDRLFSSGAGETPQEDPAPSDSVIPQYRPDDPGQHGDGDIDNEILEAFTGFVPGQWYLYRGGTDTTNLQKFIDHVT